MAVTAGDCTGEPVPASSEPALSVPGLAVLPAAAAPPERTLVDVFDRTVAGYGDAPALDDGRACLDYRALGAEVSSLAARLHRAGIGAGDRVGVRVPSGTADLYAAILGVLAAGAAYVPVDADDPDERAQLVWSEAGVCAVLGAGLALTTRPGVVPRGETRQPRPDDDAWIIFTSGSTGQPKGVAISHRSAAAFVDAEAALFARERPPGPGDRVLAGLSVAFDASCEEMWLAWRHGGCLVPAPRALVRAGADFGDWLAGRRITVVSTVPTLAALWPPEAIARVRLLILGGEACPAELAARLCGGSREVWNTYGPTEATVVSCAAPLSAKGPVRIGLPLEGWQMAVLGADGQPVPWGQAGELVIGGAGLGRYLDAAKDSQKYAPVPALGWQRGYRSGDLVRADPAGLLFIGRADDQVKLGGRRIELGEIDAALRALPGVRAAAAAVKTTGGGAQVLAGYIVPEQGAAIEPALARQALARQLPAALVPRIVVLDSLPTRTSGKADRASLPWPPPPASGTGSRMRVPAPRSSSWPAAGDDYVAPAGSIERALANLLASMLDAGPVSADSHFFDDLGADSLMMARFNAAARQHAGLPAVSMKDIYLHPTVRGLATVLAEREPACQPAPASPDPGPAPAGRPRYVLCGALQLLVFLACVCAGSLLLVASSAWAIGGHGLLGIYGRLVVFGGALLGLGLLPIAAKWVLIGRWKPRRIRVWSLAYLRFWIVKTLTVHNPLARLCIDTPLYSLYLRALGARIGAGVLILTSHVPVCTDLLTIGPGSVIRKDTYLNGYRASSGVIEIGAVTLGADVFVGENTVLDIDTAMGDGAQLGHSSALHAGQAVPGGQCWHGSPARPAEPGHDYRTVAPARCGTARRAGACAMWLLLELAVAGPVGLAVAGLLLAPPRRLAHLLAGQTNIASWAGDRAALIAAAVLVFGLLLPGLLFVSIVPRLLSRALKTGKVYPLYGFHHGLQRMVSRLSNVQLFVDLFGDSSAIVHYLRAIGYRLAPVQQSGSNFGTEVGHEVPTLCSVGTGTVVADGLTFMNAEFSASSFRVMPVAIGPRNFLGNAIAYPAGGRTGDNCLLATKAMIPVAGPVREGTGLLGSPCFEIPRTVQRDHRFDHLATGAELKRRLAAKNRHNAATVALYLLVRYLYVVGLLLVVFWRSGRGDWPDWASTSAAITLMLGFTVAYFVLVERAVTGFRPLRPRYCSIYQVPFWRHERYWKLHGNAYLAMFDGTPFKGMLWRLLGVRMGRRVFDDGCSIVERTLVSVGSDCTLGAGSIVHCHSLEDGTFKSDHVTIGDRCTVGTGAWILYGTTMGDGSVLDADSFLMKGEHVPPRARWRGNPATEIPASHGQVPSRMAAGIMPQDYGV
jgi:non-ribosomal peptide synthetase-like protein